MYGSIEKYKILKLKITIEEIWNENRKR
jgi:hypothetical protein